MPPGGFGLRTINADVILGVMPTLRSVAKIRQQELGNIFEGFHFIFILHFLSDLLGFLEAFRMLGLPWDRAHFLYKDYRYPYRERIAGQLEANSADVFRLMPGEGLKRFVGNIIEKSKADGRKIIIVEDGGYVVPLIHREFQDDLERFQGAVEQTTKGINQDLEVLPLKIPLLSVASSKVKREKESPEIAKVVWNNVQRLLWDRDLRNAQVLIIGYGNIGKNLARHLRTNGVLVKVFDQIPEKRQEANGDGYTVGDSIEELVKNQHGLIVVGATGKPSITEREIKALGNTSVLVSASSDQIEIGLKVLERHSFDPTPLIHPASGNKSGDIYRLVSTRNEVTLLAEGYPVNFWDAESMPYTVSQVALVPLYLSAVAIAAQASDIRIGEPDSDFVDRLIDEVGIYDEL
jgi:adenosylhomocysteinase